MATKSQKIRLSLFLLGSSAILLLFFVVLVGNSLLKRMDKYYIVYEQVSVTGLEAGAPVKFNGVQVGRVSGLKVRDAASVILEIEVTRGTPIRQNTQAVLTLIGITGLKFVELMGGTTDSPPLPPKSTILAGKSLFDSISGSAEVMLAKLEQILNNLNDMTGPETATALTQSLVAIASLSMRMDSLLVQNNEAISSATGDMSIVMANLAVATARIDSTAEAINTLVRSRQLQDSVEDINHITSVVRAEVDSMQLADTARQLRELMTSSGKMIMTYDQLGTRAREDVLSSLRSLEETLENLREATDVIRENPSVLLRGRRTAGDRIE